MAKIKETVAKVTGAAKKAAAVATAKTGIMATLEKEHGEVTTLMKEVQAAGDGENALNTRRELYPKIRNELLSHAHAEQKIFYAELLLHNETKAMVSHSTEEHQEIERAFGELDVMDPSDSAWFARFEELVGTVQEHVQEEESELFALAKDVLSDEQLRDFDDQFKAEKQIERDQLGATPPSWAIAE